MVIAAHAPQVKPKAYLPMLAGMPPLRREFLSNTKAEVIKVAAKVNQNQPKKRTAAEAKDARRLHGERRDVKNAMTAKSRPMR